MTKFYVNNQRKIESVSLENLRNQLNRINGTPMPRGIAPKYEYSERMAYSCGIGNLSISSEISETERFYDEQEANDWYEDYDKFERQNYAIKPITEFVVGYNAFGKFHECDKFDTESEAIEWVNSACDELIANDQERSYYDSEAEAQADLEGESSCVNLHESDVAQAESRAVQHHH